MSQASLSKSGQYLVFEPKQNKKFWLTCFHFRQVKILLCSDPRLGPKDKFERLILVKVLFRGERKKTRMRFKIKLIFFHVSLFFKKFAKSKLNVRFDNIGVALFRRWHNSRICFLTQLPWVRFPAFQKFFQRTKLLTLLR